MTGPIDRERTMRIDGRSYSRESLLEFSLERMSDRGEPAWRKDIFSFIAQFLDPDNGPITQKSSGSTGDPKSFNLSREAMVLSAARTLRYFNLKKGQHAMLSLPVNYIAGKMMVVRALTGGLHLILTEPSSRPLQHLVGSVDFAAMVPLQAEESLLHHDPMDRISKLIIGGGELQAATREKLSKMAVPEVYESFGMTETYTHFALRRINGSDQQSCFKLLEGVKIGLDHRGCLEVEVPGITSGTLVTNDLAEISESNDGFTWLGRFDNLINTGGIKIIPELLEKRVRGCIGHECLVLPEPDPKLGQRILLMVEYNGINPPLEEWMEKLRERVSGYELPKRIVTVSSIPRNRSMKPDRTTAGKLLL